MDGNPSKVKNQFIFRPLVVSFTTMLVCKAEASLLIFKFISFHPFNVSGWILSFACPQPQ